MKKMNKVNVLIFQDYQRGVKIYSDGIRIKPSVELSQKLTELTDKYPFKQLVWGGDTSKECMEWLFDKEIRNVLTEFSNKNK